LYVSVSLGWVRSGVNYRIGSATSETVSGNKEAKESKKDRPRRIPQNSRGGNIALDANTTGLVGREATPKREKKTRKGAKEGRVVDARHY